jgi:hypothetical protein
VRTNLDPGRHHVSIEINRRRRFLRSTFCGGQSPGDSLAAFGSLNTGFRGVDARDLETFSAPGDHKYEYGLGFQHQAPLWVPIWSLQSKTPGQIYACCQTSLQIVVPMAPLAVQTPSQLLFVLPVFLLALYVVHQQFLSPLARIPGPFDARVSIHFLSLTVF